MRPPFLLPVFTPEEALAFEGTFFGGDSAHEWAVMEGVGVLLAAELERDWGLLATHFSARSLLLLLGKGHNAADALLTAARLVERHPQLAVTALWPWGRAELKPLTQRACEQLETAAGTDRIEHSEGFDAALLEGRAWDIVLDGLVGTRFAPPLRAPVPELLERVNASRTIRLRAAVDLPSGLAAEGPGEAVFRADFSYATGLIKSPGTAPGARTWTGRLRFLDLGFPLDGVAGSGSVVAPWAHRSLLPLRAIQADKRHYGRVLIVAGSGDMPGAALMAAQAAVQAGAGLVTVCAPATTVARCAGQLPEAMWRSLPVDREGHVDGDVTRRLFGAAEGCDAVLVGPGLELRRNLLFALLRFVRESALPMVLDASALQPELMPAVQARAATAAATVLTPHGGEFRRLLPGDADPDDPQAALELARRLKATLVLKGPVSQVIDGERSVSAPWGEPVLARGGSGDLLAGMLVTLLAQRPGEAWSCALAAVAWQGAAARLLARREGEHAVRTTQLLGCFAAALKDGAQGA